MPHKIIACSLLSLFMATTANAGTKNDEDTLNRLVAMDIESLMNIEVTTASRYAEGLSDAPGIVSFMNAEEIENSGAQNLMDLISRLPGVYAYHTLLFRYTAAGTRGNSGSLSNHTLLTLNGRPLRPNYTGAEDDSIFGTFPIHAIERIELVRGPGSVLYGTNAMNSVINIITKKTKASQEALIKIGYGSHNTKTTEANYGYKHEKFDIFGAVQAKDSDGFKSEVADFLGNVQTNKYPENTNSVFINANSENFSINALHTYLNTQAFSTPAIYPLKKSWRQLDFIDLGYTADIHKNWTLNINGSYTNTDQHSPGILRAESHATLGEVMLTGKISDNTHIITGGTYEVLYGDSALYNFDYSTERAGYYAQIDYRPVHWLKLIGGFQLNKPKQSSRDFSPRLGSIFNITENFGVKILYGEAFRSPYPAQLFLEGAPIANGNTDLKPETSETIDVQAFYHTDKLYAAINVFRSKYKDLIVVRNSQYSNAGFLKTAGGTAELKYNINDDWSVSGSVTLQDNYDEMDSSVFLSPEIFGKAGLVYRGFDGIVIDLHDEYSGETNAAGKPLVSNSKSADNFHNVTATINIDLSKQVEALPEGVKLSISGHNLLDEDLLYYQGYSSSLGSILPARAGRSVYAAISYKF